MSKKKVFIEELFADEESAEPPVEVVLYERETSFYIDLYDRYKRVLGFIISPSITIAIAVWKHMNTMDDTVKITTTYLLIMNAVFLFLMSIGKLKVF